MLPQLKTRYGATVHTCILYNEAALNYATLVQGRAYHKHFLHMAFAS
ncbi:50s ribosomal protein l13 [Moniliophthora roreri]|nr:50s ribosomal protein l13 [Moniliophthora roreri]